MSYIRCLSNPEKLYIWDEAGGNTAISVAGDNIIRYVKTRNFRALLSKWFNGDWEKGKSGKLTLVEEQIPHKNPYTWVWIKANLEYLFLGKNRLGSFWDGLKATPEAFKWYRNGNDFKWILYDGKKKICEMWQVTLFYIAYHNENFYKKRIK